MCGLCGIFGGTPHWTDPAGDGGLTGARQRQAAMANAVLGRYGLTLKPWMGRFTLASRTGKSAVVDNLGALWPAAERLAGRACDPLDPDLLAALERR
jgi:hypothetical protein